MHLFSGLRMRLTAVVLAALVPGLALVLISAERAREAEYTRSVQELTHLSMSAATSLDGVHEGCRLMLAAIADAAEVRSGNAKATTAYLARLVTAAPQYPVLTLAHANGDVWASVPPLKFSNVASHPGFQITLAQKRFVVGQVELSTTINRVAVPMRYPILDASGNVKDMAIALLDVSHLSSVFSGLDLSNQRTVAALDADGRVAFRYPENALWSGADASGTAVAHAIRRSPEGGVVLVTGVDGVQRLMSFSPVVDVAQTDPMYVAVSVPMTVVYAESAERLKWELLALGAVAAFAVGGAWVGGNLLVLRPIERVLSATHRLTSGDSTARVGAPYHAGQLGELAKDFDAMADALEERHDARDVAVRALQDAREHLERMVSERTSELESRNKSLQAAVGELELANERVSTAYEALKEADRAKDDFLANMSHELRTPLNSIIGYAGVLAQGLAGEINDEQRTQLAMVRRSGERLLALINDILDLSRIEAGGSEATPAAFKLSDVVNAAAEIIRPLVDAAGLAFVLDDACEDVSLCTDEQKIHQVLVNLLGNAVKFTDAGSIALRVRVPDPDTVRFEVEDTGVGIAPDDLAAVFGEFVQVAHDGGKPEGTGLGLAISRRITLLLGGTLTATSDPGEGSVFVLTLPRSLPAGRTPEAASGPNP
jgi:signal transduction histidine kinase